MCQKRVYLGRVFCKYSSKEANSAVSGLRLSFYKMVEIRSTAEAQGGAAATTATRQLKDSTLLIHFEEIHESNHNLHLLRKRVAAWRQDDACNGMRRIVSRCRSQRLCLPGTTHALPCLRREANPLCNLFLSWDK